MFMKLSPLEVGCGRLGKRALTFKKFEPVLVPMQRDLVDTFFTDVGK